MRGIKTSEDIGARSTKSPFFIALHCIYEPI